MGLLCRYRSTMRKNEKQWQQIIMRKNIKTRIEALEDKVTFRKGANAGPSLYFRIA